jgi:hypothetical protein
MIFNSKIKRIFLSSKSKTKNKSMRPITIAVLETTVYTESIAEE